MKTYLYLRVLDLLSTIVQENYPYHVEKVIIFKISVKETLKKT